MILRNILLNETGRMKLTWLKKKKKRHAYTVPDDFLPKTAIRKRRKINLQWRNLRTLPRSRRSRSPSPVTQPVDDRTLDRM